jgi:LTXXQ motif family protein
MSWTQTFVAAFLTATLFFGGVVGLAVWAAPSWAGALWNSDHTWFQARSSGHGQWRNVQGRNVRNREPGDFCSHMAVFDTDFVKSFVATELDLNASQKADFQALVVTVSQSAERLRAQTCHIEASSGPLPSRFIQYARAVDQTSEEMHAIAQPLTQFYEGLAEEQRAKLDRIVEHRGRH